MSLFFLILDIWKIEETDLDAVKWQLLYERELGLMTLLEVLMMFGR